MTLRRFAVVLVALAGVLVIGEMLVLRFRGPAAQVSAVATAAPSATASALSPTDAWAYCAAIGTIDRPDAKYLGDGTREVIQDALAIAEQRPQRFADPAARRVAIPWRCMEGAVWACDPGANLPCGAARTSREPTDGMRAFCGEHPDGVLPAFVTGHDTIFAWSCRGGQPSLDRQVFQVDARGFVANFWVRLDRPAR